MRIACRLAAISLGLAASCLAAEPAAAQTLVPGVHAGGGAYRTGADDCGSLATVSAGVQVRSAGRAFVGSIGEVLHSLGDRACDPAPRVVLGDAGVPLLEYGGSFLFYSPRFGLLAGITGEVANRPVDASVRGGLQNVRRFGMEGDREWREWVAFAAEVPLAGRFHLQVEQGWHRAPVGQSAPLSLPNGLTVAPPREDVFSRWEPMGQVSLRLRP
jgi:hypothetical protein